MTISSKIGLHLFGARYRGALGRPAISVTVDPSVADVATIRGQIGPDGLIVVRWYQKQQPLDNPEARAEAWYAMHWADMVQMQQFGPVAFLGLNEIGDAQAALYARYELRRLERMHGGGFRCAVGAWSVGVPELSMWPVYAPVLDAMRADDLVALHEYYVDTADLENRWHVARFSLPDVAPYLAGHDLVITEFGRDVVEGRGKAGWKRTCNAETYLSDLQRAGEIYDQYDQVLGVTVYQYGSDDDEWAPFSVDSIWPTVVLNYAAAPAVEEVPVTGTKDNPIQEPLMAIDGRCLDAAEFETYVGGVVWDEPRTSAWLHHTWRPTVATWAGAATIAAMRRTYGTYIWQDTAGLWHAGWDKGPHLFVAEDGIWLFYDITHDGYHAGGAYNVGSIGIEMVGDYDAVQPSGAVLSNTLAVLGILCHTLGLDPQDLKFHRDNPAAGKTCPGAAVTKSWIIPLVEGWMAEHYAAQPYLPHIAEAGVTDAWQVLEKTRWWLEEMQRQFEAGNTARADEIRLSLIQWMYERENALKAG